LIGVILAAMSSGYAMGGWLADRHPGGAVLASLLLASGAWTFLLAWKGHPVMFAVADWVQDPRWGPCLAASILLAPPAFGLSGALPALLRLSIADMGHLGRHTGGMIAVSTVGSLVGTWGGGRRGGYGGRRWHELEGDQPTGQEAQEAQHQGRRVEIVTHGERARRALGSWGAYSPAG
jgi:hypothetical protein